MHGPFPNSVQVGGGLFAGLSMAENMKARIAALKSASAAGNAGHAAIARTNEWRTWAAAQNMDFVEFCREVGSSVGEDAGPVAVIMGREPLVWRSPTITSAK